MSTRTKITISQLCEQSNIPAKLIRAVVRQSGGWSRFREIASDVVNHGADGGFSGWIYYAETCGFAKRNREEIIEFVQQMAEDIGDSDCAAGMVAKFRCLHGDYKRVEVARALYTAKGGDNDVRTQVENALAWFALEEVCRAFVYMVEND